MNVAALILQWRELNGRHPSTWPRGWRNALLLTLFLAGLLAGWQLYLTSEIHALARSEDDYAALKSVYQEKHRRAMMFAHSAQRIQELEQHLAALEQQLQPFIDIDLALDGIGDAALKNRLQFEFARPGRPETKRGYVEAPITIRLSGNYHDVGRFTADMAAFPRLVILDDMRMSNTDRPGQVTLEAIVLTYRRNPGKEEKS
jgi:type IV pilus assembly protein PilO